MRTLVVGDVHLIEEAISEIRNIFAEILKIEADSVILLGDFFDKNRPTPKELDFGTKIIYDLKKRFGKVTLIRGNHPAIKEDENAVNYLQWMGISVVNDYIDKNNNYYGHFMTSESKLHYGTGKCGIVDLKKYNYVFLGHQHLCQELLKGKIYHLGSIRWVNFNEVEDKYKQIAVLEDDKVEFISLKSPTPMMNITSIKELSNINPNTKIRMIIASFNQFKKDINRLADYKDKFVQFKVKLDFQQPVETIKKANEEKNLQEIINKWLKEIVDKDVKEILKEEFKNG